MVTFKIIEELETKGKQYTIDRYTGNSLWLADDSTLIAGCKEDLETNVKILKEAAGRYRLNINQEKIKIIQVRGTDRPRKIGRFEVVDMVKYLRVIIGGRGRDIFQYEREELVERAQKKQHRLEDMLKKAMISPQ